MTLAELFDRPRPVLLDGATGTELERRGFALNAAGWSARAIETAPELLRQIHCDYVDAGAEIVTANTFRLHSRNLADWGREPDQSRLVDQAVGLARRAAGKRALVAASLAPIGDCYTPGEVPQADDLEIEHSHLARAIAQAGADLILIETMVDGREALAASRAAQSTGLPFIVSFVTGPGGRLLSGELLSDVIPLVRGEGPAAIAVNCCSIRDVPPAIAMLVAGSEDLPAGVWANTGERSEDGSWRVTTASQPAVYAGIARTWIASGIRLIGGCCGTTPAHVAAIQSLISE